MGELISRRTRIHFREYLTGHSLREISDFFDAENITKGQSNFNGSGQRRILVEDYYSSLNFSKLSDVEKILRVYEAILISLSSVNKDYFSKLLSWLESDGFMFESNKLKPSIGNSFQATQLADVSHIWTSGKIRFFISHRDIHKVAAKELGASLDKYGITSFVAHDSIQSMSVWKHEILKALHTMDACVCYITKDFYESEWTNQEVGYAVAKGVPVYLYSVDKTDPKGFKLDIQAIKTGLPELLSCIKRDFSKNSIFKNSFIQNFVGAINGSFSHAKDKFFELVDIDLADEDIDEIVQAFSAKAKHANQLGAVLTDPIKEEHKKHPKLRAYTYYREFLNNDIFPLHSTKSYEVAVVSEYSFAIKEKAEELV